MDLTLLSLSIKAFEFEFEFSVSRWKQNWSSLTLRRYLNATRAENSDPANYMPTCLHNLIDSMPTAGPRGFTGDVYDSLGLLITRRY